jgi:CSLREA domain-containing protein
MRLSRTFVIAVAVLWFMLTGFSADAATITVTSAGDTIALDAGCTLREAITAANTNAAPNADCTAGTAGLDTITFNIPGGPHTIAVTGSDLPALVDPVFIDGYSQPGSSANTLATGDDSNHQITLDGNALPAASFSTFGLVLNQGSGGSTIRGLVVIRFKDGGILVNSAGNTFLGNFIGVDRLGVAQGNGLSNSRGGIAASNISGSAGGFNTIGTSDREDRNVVSANGGPQIVLANFGGASDSNTVQGNYVGTNIQGTAILGPGTFDGIRIEGSKDNVIGGTTGTNTGTSCTGSCNLV